MTITHTEERKLELTEAMQSLRTDTLSPKNAGRLRGRMVFFEGYTFGRVANAAVKNLGRMSLNQNIENVLVEDLKTALRFLIKRVKSAEPVRIEKCLLATWLVFTDGACVADDKFGGIGGLLISPSGACVSFFSSAVPLWMMERLLEHSANPIHELELLPISLAAMMWTKYIGFSQVVWYVDNESSRMAAIRGSGETFHASSFIES